MIRKAESKDTKDIHALIEYYAKKETLLPRTLEDISEAINDFFVYDDGRIAGCAAVHLYSSDLAEIRSLAVDDSRQKEGIGGALLKACLEEAGRLGVGKVFVLTGKADFFKRFGFSEIDKSELPQKIWNDCIVCPKYTECDEVAYIKEL